jgi:Right handed beta helix region
MAHREHRFVALLAVATLGSCGGSSGAQGGAADAGTSAEGGTTSDAGGGVTPDGGGAPGTDGGSGGGEAGLPEAGSTVTPGNGCAAGLGVDAGFYTCKNQYFVAPTGNDSNGGTSVADALLTIGAATKLALKGGDCVTVADGTYDETVLVTTSGSADTCTGYAVFRSASPGGAKVVSTDAYNGFMVNASYVMVDGFDLEDTSTGSAFTAGTNTLSGGKVVVYHHIAAIRNIAHDSGGAGLGALHADYVRFEGNIVHDNATRSDYGDSGIDLWEMQASDTQPGFHIVVRNNLSYANIESDIAAALQTDGEGIILDSFDYADPTYGTTPYAQETLVENNVIWKNGGRGIEAAGAQPTSHVTIRNNTLFDDNTQAQQYGGAEIVSWGNGNAISNNIVVLGPDAQNGSAANQTTVAIADRCGPSSAGVSITGGSVWANNLVATRKTGAPLTSSNCVTTATSYTTIPTGSNLFGVDPGLAAETATGTLTAQDFGIAASNPATHAGTSTDFAPFDYAYVARPQPPSIGAFEP